MASLGRELNSNIKLIDQLVLHLLDYFSYCHFYLSNIFA